MILLAIFLQLLLIISAGDVLYYSANYIYIDSSTQRTWEDANEHCRANYGTRLATIKSSADQVEVLQVTDGTPGGEPKWIGCHSVGDKILWARDSTSCSDAVYASWHKQEGSYELDRCFAIDEPSGKWLDYSCTSKRDFICNHPHGRYSETFNLPIGGLNENEFLLLNAAISAIICLLIICGCISIYYILQNNYLRKKLSYKIVDFDEENQNFVKN